VSGIGAIARTTEASRPRDKERVNEFYLGYVCDERKSVKNLMSIRKNAWL
jgi:hypothetical protein